MSTLVKLAIVAGAVALAVNAWPDIKRYIEMSRM